MSQVTYQTTATQQFTAQVSASATNYQTPAFTTSRPPVASKKTQPTLQPTNTPSRSASPAPMKKAPVISSTQKSTILNHIQSTPRGPRPSRPPIRSPQQVSRPPVSQPLARSSPPLKRSPAARVQQTASMRPQRRSSPPVTTTKSSF